MPAFIPLCLALAGQAAPAGATRAAVTYRVQDGDRGATVWVAGADARMEHDDVEGLPPRGAAIWKDGGKTIVVVDDKERTYYDQIAYLSRSGSPFAPVATMTAAKPFEVGGVKKVRVEVRDSGDGAAGCRPVTVAFSYELQLRMANVPGTFPASVEGTSELCYADSFAIAALPFGHGVLPKTGLEEVDKVFAERLSALRGTIVRQKFTATRRIENGEPVTKSAASEISAAKQVEVPAARFQLPAGYRFQEPVIVGPQRQ